MQISGNIDKKYFGKTKDGIAVDIYYLKNKNNMEAGIMSYGGTVVLLKAPDRNGKIDDIVLGYDQLEGYLSKSPYFGSIIGRYGNRIANGKFSLENREYILDKNDGPNHLHGGVIGFDKIVWDAEIVKTREGKALRFFYLSKDGDQGYPGNLKVEVVYSLTDDNALKIQYHAETDKATIINLTNHSYFNLRGSGSVLDNEIKIHADHFTPVNEKLIPTGEIRKVKGTPMDFSDFVKIGERIDQADQQLEYAGGYDHNWVLNKDKNNITKAAEVYEPLTGRVLEVYTTEPGMQFYTGNFLDGTIKGKNHVVYHKRAGFCLETQHFPDSPNQPGFPSTVLRPGETYSQITSYKCGVR
jgi:aldose 1-epimerase